MGGICGIINFDGAPVDTDRLTLMAQAAIYRGPDGVHTLAAGNVGFTHLALNLSPCAQHERQSQIASIGNLTVVADARIDNQDELVGALWPGDDFNHAAPTVAELIIGAYRKWGSVCPAYLVGDFVFALWDNDRKQLFAARDPMGMRTLYYRHCARSLLFATEIKQILAIPEVTAELFEPAVGVYLAGPFMRPEWTLYKNITQLAPAHTFSATAESQRTQRYWDIDPSMRISYARDEEYIEHFRMLFEEAVRCRIHSTKPVGIFLSGGVDSGSIATMAGWLHKQSKIQQVGSVHAYCWAFEELKSCDERHISDQIAHHSQIPVTSIPADDCWPFKGYPAFGPDRNDPFIWPYQALTERTLAAAAHNRTGVILSGDRGDEMVGDWVYDFGGLALTGRWGILWGELRAIMERDRLSLLKVVKRHLLRQLLAQIGLEDVTLGMRSRPKRSSIPAWVHPRLARCVDWQKIFNESEPQLDSKDVAQKMRYARIFMFQGSRIASLNERTVARYGMEYADPWSDRRIAEFVLATPQHIIQRVREPKRIARQMLRQMLPTQMQHAPHKIIPEALFDRGFKEKARETIEQLIAHSQAAELGYVDKAALHSAYVAYLSAKPIRHDFWWPLTFEMWLQQHWN